MLKGIASGIAALLIPAFALAGASEGTITMQARSNVVSGSERALLLGTVSSGQPNEYVAVRGKECGVPGAFFRGMAGATTTDGGQWTVELFIGTTTTFRAEWEGNSSPTLTVRKRPQVTLEHRGGRRFDVEVIGVTGFAGKRLRIQRYDASSRTWRLVRTVVLETSDVFSVAVKKGIVLAVPKGTTLRAHLPLSQTKPCYLAGYSKLIRT